MCDSGFRQVGAEANGSLSTGTAIRPTGTLFSFIVLLNIRLVRPQAEQEAGGARP